MYSPRTIQTLVQFKVGLLIYRGVATAQAGTSTGTGSSPVPVPGSGFMFITEMCCSGHINQVKY